MANNKAKAGMKYRAKTYDRFMLEFTKGTKEEVAKYVQAHGMTMRSYILGLIEKDCGIDMQIYKTKNAQ